jgi:hypothetical protein
MFSIRYTRERGYGTCQLPLKSEYPEAVDPMGIPVKFVFPLSPVYFPVPPVHWKSPSHRGWPLHCHTRNALSPSSSVTVQ